MKKLGFYGGCFNPPTFAHIELAKSAIDKLDLDDIIFVPVNCQYGKKDLIEEKHRYNMLNLLCEDNEKFKVSDIEFKIKQKLYAINIFNMIKQEYKDCEIYFLMGSDNLKDLPNWNNAEELAKDFKYIILQRDDIDSEEIIQNNSLLYSNKDNFTLVKSDKNINISSSKVRDNIRNKNSVQDFIPYKIQQYIQQYKLYIN